MKINATIGKIGLHKRNEPSQIVYCEPVKKYLSTAHVKETSAEQYNKQLKDYEDKELADELKAKRKRAAYKANSGGYTETRPRIGRGNGRTVAGREAPGWNLQTGTFRVTTLDWMLSAIIQQMIRGIGGSGTVRTLYKWWNKFDATNNSYAHFFSYYELTVFSASLQTSCSRSRYKWLKLWKFNIIVEKTVGVCLFFHRNSRWYMMRNTTI